MILALVGWIGCSAPVRELHQGGELGVEVGGVEGPAPVVVAIHGLGDVPGSLVGLVEACRLPVRVVAPRGPAAHHDGWSWYDVTPGPGGATRDVVQLRASAERVAALIRRLADAPDTVGRPVVTGFSQGGVLSFAVAAQHPEAVGLAVPIAGALPASLLPTSAGATRIASAPPTGPPSPTGPSSRVTVERWLEGPAIGHGAGGAIRAVHGTADGLVPLADARATVDGLRAVGFDAELRAFDGVGHEVTAEVHREVCAALASALPP